MFRNNVWFSGSACLSPFVKGAAVKTTQHPKVPDGGAQHQTHVRVLQHLPLKLSAPLTNTLSVSFFFISFFNQYLFHFWARAVLFQ